MRITNIIAIVAVSLVALAACGGNEDSEVQPALTPLSPSVSVSVTPTPSSTPSPSVSASAGGEQAFIDSFRSKVESGDYEPTKDTSPQARQGAKQYVERLSDERLLATGQYACQARKDGLNEEQFVDILLKNKGTEEGVKPVLNLIYQEATTILCPIGK